MSDTSQKNTLEAQLAESLDLFATDAIGLKEEVSSGDDGNSASVAEGSPETTSSDENNLEPKLNDSKTDDKPNNQSTADKTSNLIEYVEQLVSYNEQQETSNELLSRMLDTKFAEFQFSMECKMENFISAVTAKLNQLKASSSTSSTMVVKTENQEDNDEGPQEWDTQKKKILEDYGFESEESKASKENSESLNSEAAEGVTDQVEAKIEFSPEAPEELDRLHDSIKSLASIDSSEIEELKEMLTSKLRDAEVELSINRAKLSQQMAALELKQHELEQKEASLEGKYGKTEDGVQKKPSILDRFSRHMSKKPKSDRE